MRFPDPHGNGSGRGSGEAGPGSGPGGPGRSRNVCLKRFSTSLQNSAVRYHKLVSFSAARYYRVYFNGVSILTWIAQQRQPLQPPDPDRHRPVGCTLHCVCLTCPHLFRSDFTKWVYTRIGCRCFAPFRRFWTVVRLHADIICSAHFAPDSFFRLARAYSRVLHGTSSLLLCQFSGTGTKDPLDHTDIP